MRPEWVKPRVFGIAASLVVGMAVLATYATLHAVAAQQSGLSRYTESADKLGADVWSIARGGQLYDDWGAALDKELPQKTHPSYPSIGKKKGGVSWRCMECHGWDYMGEDGAYGRGDHYTGVKGIRHMAGKRVEDIEEVLVDKTHQYTDTMIPPGARRKLALFVSKGQINMDQYIDRSTKRARGDVRRGALFFHTVCAICHGFDGAEMISKSENELAAFGERGLLGTIATTDPYETLHKIRNGQPGVGMVTLRILSVRDQVDVLAYLQTLTRRSQGN